MTLTIASTLVLTHLLYQRRHAFSFMYSTIRPFDILSLVDKAEFSS